MAHPRPPVLKELLEHAGTSRGEVMWTQFLAEFNKLILRVCHSFGGDHDAVMDRYSLVIEHLRRDSFRALRAFDPEGPGRFTTWLTVVVRRVCLDERRKRYGRRQANTNDAEQQEKTRRDLADLVAADVDPLQIADTAALPDAVTARAELHGVLHAALAELDAESRLILRFRYEQDLSVPEIARLIGAPTPFHVYRRIDKLLAGLRLTLERADRPGMVG
jgi:RNA polymerase sigma factor (sigma-70 family)